MKIKDASKKEKVLKKIRRALVEKSKEPFTGVDYDSNVFIPFNEVAEIEFAMKKMLITKLDTYFNLVIFSLLINFSIKRQISL